MATMRTPPRADKKCECFRFLEYTLIVKQYPDDFEGMWRYTDTHDPLAVSSVLVGNPLLHQGQPWISYYQMAGDVEWSLRFDDLIGCGDPEKELLKKKYKA